MISLRLDHTMIDDLMLFSLKEGFPHKMTERMAKIYCTGRHPIEAMSQIYGSFDNNTLVGIMTATYGYVSPSESAPNGRIVYVSGAYVLPDYRYQGRATALLRLIESDARVHFGADYICCDDVSLDLLKKIGFGSDLLETMMYKSLTAVSD